MFISSHNLLLITDIFVFRMNENQSCCKYVQVSEVCETRILNNDLYFIYNFIVKLFSSLNLSQQMTVYTCNIICFFKY